MNIKPLDVLHKYYGYTSFRKGQENIITSIINKEDVLAIMPTGGGKSICYQVPALCLDGITIVISPLISLMKDQVDALKTMGVKARLINSSLSNSEYSGVLEEIENDECKIIYIAPERLDSMEFVNIIRGKNISQVAIDEAHCVSQWGHDFRVSYKKIPYFINRLDKRPIVTAFTATASNEVREDIINILNLHNPAVYITGFDRENLSINIVKSSSKNKYTLDYVENHKNESGIIYASTRKEVETIYEGLLKRNYSVAKYHAGLSNEARKEYQENFINDDIKIMVATNAFGMGIDKPNIRWVLHYNMPQSIENYYQEIGRAGRDGEDIINIVKEYIQENNINPKWEEKKRLKLVLDGDSRKNDEIALDLLNQNKDINDVADELEISVSTVLGYVYDYIKLGNNINFDIDLKCMYNENEKEMILDAINRFGDEKVSVIKKVMPDYVKYESIRAVILERYIS